MCLPQIVYLFKNANELDKMLELMPTLTGTVICIMKVISLTYNVEKFKMLLRQTCEDWDSLLTIEETQILTRYAENSRKFTLLYSICVIGFVCCYAFLPLIEPILDIISPLNETRPRKMQHSMDYVVLDLEKHYYLILLNTYLGYIVCLMIAVATDTMYVVMVVHICGMYNILCNRLEKITTYDNYTYQHDEIGRRVRHCIQLHKRIKLFIETMESTFALFLLFDIGGGFLLHTSSCIMIVIRIGSSEIVRYVALVIMQSCRLFFNSWAGQQVIDHSLEVSIAAYKAVWYNISVKTQKLLILLIARSQKPTQITMAKLYIINLQGFSTVMRTSVSYCTVMISLRESS
ncbi:odorant receptor 49b-like [Pogonomyrmex barbatus]|uniref:Odorant receptor n=1 Tax=Pogonomyrmex barbatus TaxID=144034 RepID=A0A8N1S826_9HYME|nr:odorant receptor 49b-like [Pogonomyrmex barbatus]